MITPAVYYQGADLPDLLITWEDDGGVVVDFAAGHTFEVKVAREGSTAAAFTKTTGVSGGSSPPNVVVEWATAGELRDLTPGRYTVQVVATRTADGKRRYFQGPLEVRPSIA